MTPEELFPPDTIVSSAHEAHCMIVADAGTGTGMPCSRYGRHIDDPNATAVVYAAATIMRGETEGGPPRWADLESMIGLVVNDSDGPAELIRDVGELYGFDPADYELGEDPRLEDWREEARKVGREAGNAAGNVGSRWQYDHGAHPPRAGHARGRRSPGLRLPAERAESVG
jgi:hypothetical protein